MGDPDSMSMARSYYARALKLNNKNVRALYGFSLVCSFILQLCAFEYLQGGSNKYQCYLVMDLIKHFWYLIHVEQQKEAVAV